MLDEPGLLLTVGVVFKTLLRSVVLASVFALSAAPAFAAAPATDDPAAATADVKLESSWPKEGVVLWVPPREGRLEFSAPVKTASLEIELVDSEGSAVRGKELERLTSEQESDTLLFRIPFLTEGDYGIKWSVDTVPAGSLDGTISFKVDAPLVAAGGQNHRHGEDAHLYRDTIGEFVLRILGLLPLVLLASAWSRSRRRGGTARSDRLVVRIGAVLLLLSGLVQAIADIVAYVDEFHNHPLSAALAAPAFGVLPVIVLVAGYLLLRAPVGRELLGLTAVALLVHAGLGHLTGGWSAILLYFFYAATMAGFVASSSRALVLLVDAVRARRPSWSSTAIPTTAAAVFTGVASLGMLFVHAKGFELNIDFAADLRFRVGVLLALSVSAVVVSWATTRRSRLFLLLALPAAFALTAASAALLWMPPPAAGL